LRLKISLARLEEHDEKLTRLTSDLTRKYKRGSGFFETCSFRYRDNSVHLHVSALPFGYVFSLLLTTKTKCTMFYADMRILIDKALKHFYML